MPSKNLNKVELANRVKHVVTTGNLSEFTQVEKEEQEVAEVYIRLINNCEDQQTRETLLHGIVA